MRRGSGCQKRLTAADFLSLRMQYRAARAENEWPAAIEHDFADGRMVDHYFVVPGPAVTEDEAVRDLGPVSGILFLQQPDGAPWQVLLHETAMIREVSLKCRRKNSANCCKTTAWPCPANRALCPTRRKRRREQTNAPQKQPKCPVPAFSGF